jgi:hypothetical membrane protein
MSFGDQLGVALPPKLRLAALGGVIGPAAFIGGWTVSAAITSDAYSSIDDAISRLAAVGADSRPVMSAAFISFGIALPVYAVALRRAIGGKAWVTATAAGIATLAVAATPLDRSSAIDSAHAVAAGLGYIALAATPLLAVGPLLRQGHRGLAGLGVAAGAVSGISLVLASSRLPTGFFQRLGLTAADIWIIASAVAIASGAVRPTPKSSPARWRTNRWS